MVSGPAHTMRNLSANFAAAGSKSSQNSLRNLAIYGILTHIQAAAAVLMEARGVRSALLAVLSAPTAAQAVAVSVR